ncbi:undecaprenyl-diphosphate phosphatase [Almyronema epifaneia]|uniref:Undecaprenyl-diphosphatase n=1 Tax=Almyronema epifaneia S1 TaxID=2991925 RepID=A0ABW6IE15_9CYAN
MAMKLCRWLHSYQLPIIMIQLFSESVISFYGLPVAQAASSEVLAPFNVWQAIVVGIVQGLTEFLPISSTAHVKIVPVALGWGDPGVGFTAVVQLGSIGAILGYFWDDVRQVTAGMVQAVSKGHYQSNEFRIGLGILLGTVPIVVLGLLVKLFFAEQYDLFGRSSLTIAITSIGLALLLGLAELVGRRQRGYEAVGLWDGIGMGFAQALALIPGVSRSGSTITAGLFMGLDRPTAARFSLLMGIPAILISGLVEAKDLLDVEAGDIGLLAIAAGVIASAISSYLAIYWLIRFLRDHTTWVFVFYRIGFGLVILWAIATQRMPNI